MLDDSEDEAAHDRRTDTSGRPTPIFADESEAEEQAARAEAEDEEAREEGEEGAEDEAAALTDRQNRMFQQAFIDGTPCAALRRAVRRAPRRAPSAAP